MTIIIVKFWDSNKVNRSLDSRRGDERGLDDIFTFIRRVC